MNNQKGRQVDDKNQIWFEKENQITKIGFTQSFLDSLDQCWHILPANLVKFKAKAPLLTVETNDALISIMSPVAGNFMNYSDKAQNFPDKLKENDVILELQDGHVERAPATARRAVVGDRPAGAVPRRVIFDDLQAFRPEGDEVGARAVMAALQAQAPRPDIENMRREVRDQVRRNQDQAAAALAGLVRGRNV